MTDEQGTDYFFEDVPETDKENIKSNDGADYPHQSPVGPYFVPQQITQPKCQCDVNK